MYYKLENKNIVPCSEEAYHAFVNANEFKINYDELGDDVYISTIFIGEIIDPNVPHHFFETEITGIPALKNQAFQHKTYDEAQAGHRIIKKILTLLA